MAEVIRQLKLSQLDKFKTKDSAAATHNGMDGGMYLIPDYAKNEDVREALFDCLRGKCTSNQRWAIMENIRCLPGSALTRVRFDVDVHLPTC